MVWPRAHAVNGMEIPEKWVSYFLKRKMPLARTIKFSYGRQPEKFPGKFQALVLGDVKGKVLAFFSGVFSYVRELSPCPTA